MSRWPSTRSYNVGEGISHRRYDKVIPPINLPRYYTTNDPYSIVFLQRGLTFHDPELVKSDTTPQRAGGRETQTHDD